VVAPENVSPLERSNEDFKLLTSFSHAYRAFWGLTKHVRGTLPSALQFIKTTEKPGL
jgi:hypothetical protein